jgi:hypothetical protein
VDPHGANGPVMIVYTVVRKGIMILEPARHFITGSELTIANNIAYVPDPSLNQVPCSTRA